MSMVHVCYNHHHLPDILPIIHALQMQLHNHIDFDKLTGNLVVEARNTCKDPNRLRNFPDPFTNMLMVYSGNGFGSHGLCHFLYEIEPASSWYQQYYNCEKPDRNRGAKRKYEGPKQCNSLEARCFWRSASLS